MKRFACTALAAAFLMLGSRAHAQDTIQLGGTGDARVQTLDYDGQSDIEEVYWRGGGYRGGAYRGGWGGYRGGWSGYRGGWGGWGYRPYASFYRPFAYRPFLGFRSYGYRPYSYASSYYYSTPSYYYSQPIYSTYVDPCASEVSTMPQALVLGSTSAARAPLFQTPVNPQAAPPPPDVGDGTFPYDGGPRQPMPMPRVDDPAPMNQQKRPTVPLDGKLVSIPGRPAAGYVYPAYGETARPPAPSERQDASVRLVSAPAASPARIAYPAYGER